MTDICHNANKVTKHTISKSKIQLDDFRFVLKNDPLELGRTDKLVATNKYITEAKKQFNKTDTTISKSRQYYSGIKNGTSNLSNDSNGNNSLCSSRKLYYRILRGYQQFDNEENEEEQDEDEEEND